MKTSVRHLFFLSLAVALLLAGMGCKKATTSPTVINDHRYQDSIDSLHRADSIYLATRYDFRDQLIGVYAGVKHEVWTSQPSNVRDTLLGLDTFSVTKVGSDTFAILVRCDTFSMFSRPDSVSINFYNYDWNSANFRSSNGSQFVHFVFYNNGANIQGHYFYTDANKLPR